MNDLVLWAATSQFQRERRIDSWRQYTALQNLLHGQLQRIGELDVSLGILIALESLLFVWFLDRTFDTRNTYNIVTTCFLTMPLCLSLMTALGLRGKESPNAKWFFKGVTEDENVTLTKAIDSTVKDFAWNLRVVKMKETMMRISMVSFFGLSVAYILGGVIE